MRSVALIPARMQSSRFPGKPLVGICGLPIIIHVYLRCKLARNLDDVFVATDSLEIQKEVEHYGGKVIMTSAEHETGTDRIAEAAMQIKADIIVNVQGDEALVNPEYVDKVVNVLQQEPGVDVAMLVNPFSKRNSPSDIKVVLDEADNVLYLSRSDIPSDSRTSNPPMLKAYHIVPFRKSFLQKYASWEKGKLEQIEFNEYLRILEKGYKIRAVHVDSDAVSVDTQFDLDFVRKKMPHDSFFALYRHYVR